MSEPANTDYLKTYIQGIVREELDAIEKEKSKPKDNSEIKKRIEKYERKE